MDIVGEVGNDRCLLLSKTWLLIILIYCDKLSIGIRWFFIIESNIIDFSQSDNYTKNTKNHSLGDISEASTLNYTGGNGALRKTKVNNVTHIIKETQNIVNNTIVPKKKEIVRIQKNHIMPVRSNLYLKRFKECIRLGKRCRWS